MSGRSSTRPRSPPERSPQTLAEAHPEGYRERNQRRTRLGEQRRLRPVEHILGGVWRVPDRGHAHPTALGDRAHHVEDDAGLARLVEVQAGPGDEVEEVVDLEASERLVLEVIGRHEVTLSPGRRAETSLLVDVDAVGE